jgi:lysophospholipase L1-like esterase
MTSVPPSEPLVGVVDDPSSCLPPPPADVAAFLAAMRAASRDHTPAPPAPTPELIERFGDWMRERRLLDFGDLARYAVANADLPPADAERVVFIGDSITEGWTPHAPELFQTWINRGISGQTTPQMLARFRADALDLAPRVIHILAGINDIAGNTGPTTLAWIQGNIQSMCELARAAGARVILGAVTPAARFAWRPQIECREPIAALNAWLERYAADTGAIHVDYHRALRDAAGGMPTALSPDGVHPNAAGYAIMTPLARAAVATALTPEPPSAARRR